jgi:hypothetical protein
VSRSPEQLPPARQPTSGSRRSRGSVLCADPGPRRIAARAGGSFRRRSQRSPGAMPPASVGSHGGMMRSSLGINVGSVANMFRKRSACASGTRVVRRRARAGRRCLRRHGRLVRRASSRSGTGTADGRRSWNLPGLQLLTEQKGRVRGGVAAREHGSLPVREENAEVPHGPEPVHRGGGAGPPCQANRARVPPITSSATPTMMAAALRDSRYGTPRVSPVSIGERATASWLCSDFASGV